jgi:hypothetical protein
MNKQKIFSFALVGMMLTSVAGKTPPGLVKKAERQIENRVEKRATIGQGKVIAKEGTTLTVTKESKTYTVLTDANTRFVKKFWGKSSLEEISLNDMVNVIGRWNNEAKTEIQAVLIRNFSIQKRHGVFFGEVKSVSGSGFVLTAVKRGDQTVTVEIATKLVNRKMQKISLSDIQVGHKVRVKGVWDSVNKTITEVKQVKDFSIPLIPSPRPSSSPSPKAE